jgi:hypothetical protein
VGAYDMVLSTRFDKDKDGKLNSEEKKNAYEEIKNGFMNKFAWGLEASGTYR